MLVPLLTLAMALQDRIPKDPSVQDIYRDCKISAAIQNKQIDHPDTLQWVSDGRCIAYLHGFLDAASWTKPRSICPPDGTKMIEVVRKYVEYVSKHPSQQGDDEQLGVLFGLSQAYPCAKK